MKRTAVYSGTFDPITLGHEDVARRAAGLFDELIIAVAVAHHKTTRFSLAQRIALAQAALADQPHIRVMPFDGLIMDFCRQQSACGSSSTVSTPGCSLRFMAAIWAS